jgi:predicted homoserine dehydrogenase-like protein
MMDMVTRLGSLDKPTRMAVIGVDAVGEGFLYQSGITSGMRCIAITDAGLDKAVKAYSLAVEATDMVTS